MGEFLHTLRHRFPEVLASAIDISSELVGKLKDEGFDARTASITDIPYPDETFDITHCSHVIEHLAYPDVASALDELVRVTRVGGHVIIRSPLMNPHFYSDIDHVRPYPPESVLAHFEKVQLQRRGKNKVKVVQTSFEYQAAAPFKYRTSGFLKAIRRFLLLAWVLCGWPRSGPEDYIIILQRID